MAHLLISKHRHEPVLNNRYAITAAARGGELAASPFFAIEQSGIWVRPRGPHADGDAGIIRAGNKQPELVPAAAVACYLHAQDPVWIEPKRARTSADAAHHRPPPCACPSCWPGAGRAPSQESTSVSTCALTVDRMAAQCHAVREGLNLRAVPLHAPTSQPAEGVTRTGGAVNHFVAHIGETKISAVGRKKTVYRYLGAFRTATAAALEYAREKKELVGRYGAEGRAASERAASGRPAAGRRADGGAQRGAAGPRMVTTRVLSARN